MNEWYEIDTYEDSLCQIRRSTKNAHIQLDRSVVNDKILRRLKLNSYRSLNANNNSDVKENCVNSYVIYKH